MKRGAETKGEISRRFIVRSFWVFGCFIFFSLALILRAAYLQVLNKDFLINQGNLRQVREVEISAYRGMITDRNDKPLAISIPVDSLSIRPKSFNANSDQINDLADLIKKDPEQLSNSIKVSIAKNFHYIQRQVDINTSEKVKALEIPNLNFHREYRRSYPAGEIVSQLLGYTDTDEEGIEGIELQYDGWLKGIPGRKKVLKDKYNRHIENIGVIKSPKPGKDVRLSIDLRLQYIAYKALKSAILEYKANSGSVIVLDALTSEVLAIVNHPTFNNNERVYIDPGLVRNRAILDMYEPGSSIKPFVIARAIETGAYNVSSVIDTSPVTIGRKTIRDKNELGFIDLPTVLKRSSNAGMSRIALNLESDKLWEMMSDFGFGSLVTDGFPGESRGQLHHHTEWGDIGKATMSYGYGIGVTPVQLAKAYAILANDGMHIPITLLKNRSHEGTRVISSDTAYDIRMMLEKVVADGTSRKAAVKGYRVGGKSGTAWKTSGSGGYSTDRYLAIFAGIAPLDNPRLVVVVLIDEPSGKYYYGGDVAAPVFSEVISESLQLLSIPPNQDSLSDDLFMAEMNVE
ncbi:MAG TPA: penicillin-binding protein 2 [Woeseiaceae bacterium]|nr:penicillin-binding protein 2 [Woeseiaceae bacterium]